jgi:hypothetical protein
MTYIMYLGIGVLGFAFGYRYMGKVGLGLASAWLVRWEHLFDHFGVLVCFFFTRSCLVPLYIPTR